MWQATVVSTDYEKGNLQIGVQYSNGVQTFSESTTINGNNVNGLVQVIQSRLATLTANDALVATITPSIQSGLTLQPTASIISAI